MKRDISNILQINDRYEFPEELDLDIEDGKYLSENADRTVRNKYRLHSVLVHSGGIHGGHYYAFCNPSSSQWLKFDDEKVAYTFHLAEDQPHNQFCCLEIGIVNHMYAAILNSMLIYDMLPANTPKQACN